MEFSKYFEQIELNKNDPDYQLEDFWYGFKNSMKNFYKSNNLKTQNIDLWSSTLNKYKKEKMYSLIEKSIKEYIVLYVIDVMKYDKINDCYHSNILMTNIKRWKTISTMFNFSDPDKYKEIILFEGFSSVKKKMYKNSESLLKLFKNIDTLVYSDFENLIILSLEQGHIKMLDCICKIVGHEKIISTIEKIYTDILPNNLKNISFLKLHRKYKKYYSSNRFDNS